MAGVVQLVPFLQSAGRAGIQVFLLAIPVYYLLKFLRRTRGYRVLAGILAIFAGAFAATRILGLEELGWILDRAAVFLPFALIIVFQPELRRIFAEIGGGTSGGAGGETRRDVASELGKAIASLAGKRCGALIAVEREEKLDAFVQGACHLGAPVVAELVDTIFYPGTALHDGGVVVSGDLVAMAGCIFPLGAMGDQRHLSFGTRHRAAIGLTEKTDAVVFIVSEESGMVSVACRGQLVRGLGPDSVRDALAACLPHSAGGRGGYKTVPPDPAEFERVFARLKEGA